MDQQFFLPFSPILTAIVLFVLMLLTIGRKSQTKSLKPNQPPGPPKLPLLGNMHQLASSLPHRRLGDLANKYGPLMHMQLGEFSNIVVSSPEIAKEVMKKHDIIFSSRPFILSQSVVTYNCTDVVCAPYGEYWRQLRKICIVELLSLKRVQSFQFIREGVLSDMIKAISCSARLPVNLSKMIYSATIRITLKAAFGDKCKYQDEFIQLVQKTTQMTSGFALADVFPSIRLLFRLSGLKYKLERLHDETNKILNNIINEHKLRRTGIEIGEKKIEDFVRVLLNVQEHGDLGFPLTDDNIKAVILDIFVAGGDTSSTTVEWAMSEMLRNPRVLEIAQAEVRQFFSKKGNIDEAGLHELNYLKSVIKETLRFHPPLPLLIPRECTEKCEINGYEIPTKTKVIINAWAIGRDHNYWKEADKFIPERFLDSSVDYKGTNFELIPFGAGRRLCPGIPFGITNVELLLAQLLYHFDWKLPNEMRPEDMEMSEQFGVVVRRKSELFLIPIPYQPIQQ